VVARIFPESSVRIPHGAVPCGKCRLIGQAIALWLNGWSDRSLHLAEESLSMTPADTSCACELRTRIWLAFTLTTRGEFDRVRKILYRPDDPNTSFFGPVIYPPGLSLARAHLALATGDLDAAVDLSEQVLAHAGVDNQLRIASRLILALVAWRRTDGNTASLHIRMIADDALMGRLKVLAGPCAWVNILIREMQKDVEGVAPFIEELVDFGPVSRNIFLSHSAAAPWIVRLALKTEQKEIAQKAVVMAQKLAEMNPNNQVLAASAIHAKGLLEQNIADLWRAAETQLHPWTQASAMEDIGKCFTYERSQQDQAARILEQSADAYIAVGAPRDALRIKKRLWNLGVRHHPSRWRAVPQRATVKLTETENRVAHLVAQGMTNAQTAKSLSLSTHTVAYHLKKIFYKLQISSRVELARIWNNIASPSEVFAAT